MNVLNQIIGVEEAAEIWGFSPGTIKNMCANGYILSKKIGKTWIIDKNQEKPRSGEIRIMRVIEVNEFVTDVTVENDRIVDVSRTTETLNEYKDRQEGSWGEWIRDLIQDNGKKVVTFSYTAKSMNDIRELYKKYESRQLTFDKAKKMTLDEIKKFVKNDEGLLIVVGFGEVNKENIDNFETKFEENK